jgi:hypothetical protein
MKGSGALVEAAVMTNLTVVLDNTPGSLAAVCEAVGHAGVNIEGLCCFASQGIALLYLAVEDASGARRVIEGLGLKISEERPVVALTVEDKPGGAGKLLRRFGDAEINVQLAYQVTGTRIIIGGDNIERVKRLAR